ncbi:MAG: Crp/Fnr family transcriptional regulator [Myxococcales bacterium]|nr:Crp/Fnr family transcriptional regulator [Myxococcales bacterium]
MAIPDDVRVRLLDLGISRRYQPGEVIVLQATATAGLCVVESGLVKISTTSADGREQVLRFVGTNASFNEVAALDGGPNPATATALEPSVVLRVPRDAFVTVMAETPGLPEMIVQALAGRLRHLIELVEDLSFRHVSERVARILLQSVTPHAGVGAGADLSRHVTQRELAEMAGTSREVVARALKALEAAGAISINRGEITLVAPSKLGAAR